MVRDFLVISKKTLEVIRAEYEMPYHEDKNDLKKYHSDILNWLKSFVKVAKKELEKKNKLIPPRVGLLFL